MTEGRPHDDARRAAKLVAAADRLQGRADVWRRLQRARRRALINDGCRYPSTDAELCRFYDRWWYAQQATCRVLEAACRVRDSAIARECGRVAG